MTLTDTDCQLGPAVREALKRTMTQVCNREPKIVDEPVPTGEQGISAMIDCDGDTRFTLVLSLDRDTVAPLAKTFTGVPIAWDSEILDDVVGELLNVIAGDVVAELAGREIAVKMGLPRVERSLDPARLVPGSTVQHAFTVRDSLGSYGARVMTPGGAG